MVPAHFLETVGPRVGVGVLVAVRPDLAWRDLVVRRGSVSPMRRKGWTFRGRHDSIHERALQFLSELRRSNQRAVQALMLNDSQATTVVELLKSQPIASLGTLHKAEPFVSMVPYVVVPEHGAFAIHVSSLASHTRDMVEHSAVSLLITADALPDDLPQGRPRATFQCQAERCAKDDPRYEGARRDYLARFPQAEEMFSFGDFSIFTLTPRSMRFIGGFAQAATASGTALESILAHVASEKP
jgi:heme iron utilization protein